MDEQLSRPFEIKNFNGGMTDFFLQAPSKFFEKAENFFVTNDGKLESRYGSHMYLDNSSEGRIDPDNFIRADSFLLFNDETELFVHAGRGILYNDTSLGWTNLLGAGGNKAFSHGNPYSYATGAQWNGHLFATNSDAPFPVKIFRDSTNTLQALSTGLPEVQGTASYTEDQILALCIALANAIRTSMISHAQDARYRQIGASPVTGITDYGLHYRQDLYMWSFFETVTLITGDPTYPFSIYPTPTPAPAATDLATLKTLVKAMSMAYNWHIQDSQQTTTATIHAHANFYTEKSNTNINIRGPNIQVSLTSLPDDLEECRTRLNDLRQKWFWHRLAVYTHGITNDAGPRYNYDSLNKYPVTVAAVPDPNYEGKPIATPDYTHFKAFCGILKYVSNIHFSNGYFASRSIPATSLVSGFVPYSAGAIYPPHARNIDSNHLFETTAYLTGMKVLVDLPDPSTYDEAVLTLFWCRAIYGRTHYPDSIWNSYTSFTMDTTAGSASVTDVKNSAGAAITLAIGTRVFANQNIFSTTLYPKGEQTAAVVTASGSGTATLSKVLQGTVGDQAALYVSYTSGSPEMHISYDGTNMAQSFASQAGGGELLADPSSTSESINGWHLLAEEYFFALLSHISNQKTHYVSTTLSNYSSYIVRNGDTSGAYYETYVPAVGDYIYAFVYKNTYTTDKGVEFVDFSNPILVEATDFPIQYPVGYLAGGTTDDNITFGGQNNSYRQVKYSWPTVLSNFGTLTNNALTNYNLTTTVLQIFRTIDAGNTFYLLDELSLSTTTYSDSTDDTNAGSSGSALQERETLYTTGGIVGNEPPPRAKYIHILNNIGFYAAVYDGDQYFPNRVVQSIPGSPGAVNSTFYDDFEEEITGISSVKANTIVFTKTKVARLTGGFNELGQGSLQHERVSDNVGCISAASIVQTELGLFFAGNDGFYFTDGYNIQKVSGQIDLTYLKNTKSENQQTRIKGVFDRTLRLVLWTMQTDETAEECTEIFCFHLDFGPKEDGVFTNWTNFSPSAIVIFNGNMIRGDSEGYLYEHTVNYKTDPVKDNSNPVSAWASQHIPWKYKSAALDFNTTFKGQWATRIHLVAKNISNAAIQISSIREDDNYNAKDFAQIIYNRNLTWGDPNALWEDSDCVWSYDGKIDAWRRTPAKSLRSQFRQIQIAPAYAVVYKYDDYPAGALATVDAVTKTVTIQVTGQTGYNENMSWPNDVVGMTLKIESDDYYFEYPIISVADDSFTVTDTDDRLVSAANLKWEIWGYRKEQRLQITSLDFRFGFMGQRGEASNTGEGKGNS